MASSAFKELEKELQCAICLENFKEPKVLSCQHSYCKQCLEGLEITQHRITCPECRRKTEVPRGDVTRLPSHLVLKKLLSAKDKSEARPKCERHQEKAIKLFCETCDQPICRDCTVKDHRDHDYEIIKNVFPAKKEFIMEFVRKAEAKIPALTSAIESVEERERQVQENLKVVREEIDGFINKHIASLEQKRKGLMEELEELSLTPRTRLREQRQALSESLDRVQTSVRLANKDVDRDEAEVLLNKYKIIHQMIDVCEVNTPLVPPDSIFYKLEGRPLFDDEAVGNMAKISESGEFVLSMLGGEPGVIYTTRAEQKCNFQITPRNSNETANDREDVVEVHINCACSGQVESSSVESHLDGTYTFDYCPRVKGVYHVGIYINGKRSCGSPVTWKVEPPFKISSRFSGLASKALKNSAIGRAMFAEREHTDPSECLFEGGQHFLESAMSAGGIHKCETSNRSNSLRGES